MDQVLRGGGGKKNQKQRELKGEDGVGTSFGPNRFRHYTELWELSGYKTMKTPVFAYWKQIIKAR